MLLYNYGKARNEHLNRNISMFETIGIECKGFRFFPVDIFLSHVDYLYLNWYENIYDGFFILSFIQVLIKKITLGLSRKRRIKIITSQHNKTQHDSKYPRLSAFMGRMLYSSSDIIVVFSKASIEALKDYISYEDIQRKVRYIPPVNYIDSYPFVKHKWIENLNNECRLTITQVGSLDHAYKNVDMVIEVAKEFRDRDIVFVLAGKLSNKEQMEKYTKEIKGIENIIGVFRFIHDDEMAHLLHISDIIIMPYDIESVANSGTARLAFSYAKTVICPEIPFLEAIPKELVYTYKYNDKNDHREKVRNEINKAYEDFLASPMVLQKKGEELKKIMEKNNSPSIICDEYRKIFYE